jgi:hypothetical protein
VSPRAVSPGKKQDLNVPVEQPPPVKKLVEMLVFAVFVVVPIVAFVLPVTVASPVNSPSMIVISSCF